MQTYLWRHNMLYTVVVFRVGSGYFDKLSGRVRKKIGVSSPGTHTDTGEFLKSAVLNS